MTSMMEQFAQSLSLESIKKARDLHKRIGFTIMALIIYRLGTFIPLPGVNPDMISELMRQGSGGVLSVLDLFSGGALARMTIMALGVSPYISSSIIVQLVCKLIPKLNHLTKEGEQGKRKINTYTRYLTVCLASLQGFAFAIFIEQMGGMLAAAGGFAVDSIIIGTWLFRFVTMLSLMGGTLFLMWLGEQITSRGLGNGISTIIYAGIIANLPSQLVGAFRMGREEGVYYIIPLILAVATIIFGYVVYVEKAQRRIPMQYPRRATHDVTLPNHLPLKINMAGVMPPIFAQAILGIPLMTLGSIGYLASNDYINTFLNMIKPGEWLNTILQVILVVCFAFFYTHLQFNPKETAENLKKSQAYIPGIRPGEQTEKYLGFVIDRLTVVGAAYLSTVVLIPMIIKSNIAIPFFVGGTSILIIVNVTIETISQIQTYLFAHQYKSLFRNKNRF